MHRGLKRGGAGFSLLHRSFSSGPAIHVQRPPTGIVMLNMGGPSSLEGAEDGVKPFLTNLFSDPDIIPLGKFQNTLGPFIATRRTPKVMEQYRKIGGKSPIGDWTHYQGAEMVKLLDEIAPETAPHKYYVAFRYAPPLTETALQAMAADGVQRAVAFSQYPHYSCTTSGSSFNHLWRELLRLGMEEQFKWSVIDRWPLQPRFLDAVINRINMGLQEFPEGARKDVILMFTAHSLPMKTVAKGDPYALEVAATVQNIMDKMGHSHKHVLSWQSKVGFLPWLQPSTGDVIQQLGRQGHKYILAIPIAFTSDHIETLHEIDIEYAEDAEKADIAMFKRAPSLNDEPLLIQAQAEIVKDHLASGRVSTPQYELNCPGCVNPVCRSVLNPIAPYKKLRDQYPHPSTVPTWPH